MSHNRHRSDLVIDGIFWGTCTPCAFCACWFAHVVEGPSRIPRVLVAASIGKFASMHSGQYKNHSGRTVDAKWT